MPSEIWKELEMGLGGGSKFRVFLQLILSPKLAFTRYSLIKATGLRTPTVNKYLRLLVKIGWVREYLFTPSTYQIDPQNEIVRLLIETFQKLKSVKRKK